MTYSTTNTTDFKLAAMERERAWLRQEGGKHALLNSLALGTLLQLKREGSTVAGQGNAIVRNVTGERSEW